MHPVSERHTLATNPAKHTRQSSLPDLSRQEASILILGPLCACTPSIAGAMEETQANNGYKIDLLLICGDFQACRNEQDLECMVNAHV